MYKSYCLKEKLSYKSFECNVDKILTNNLKLRYKLIIKSFIRFQSILSKKKSYKTKNLDNKNTLLNILKNLNALKKL